MMQTRYCSTCGALLASEAELCGECGARYRASPYQQRRADAPGAWSAAPQRRADAAPTGAAGASHPSAEPSVELVSRESLVPPAPGATRMREGIAQYDRPMSMPSAPSDSGWTSPPSAPAQDPAGLAPPLDGCAPGSALARLGASILDALISALVSVPLLIGVVLIVLHDGATLLAQILIGVGAALLVAYGLVLLWLHGGRALTPGKAALGLRTVGLRTGRPIGILRALGRQILLGIPLVSLIMVLPILLDTRTRRGLHDRAVGSIVVSIRSGRNPLLARPDDYARESAAHFLPSGPVPVSTHDNLMSTPGAPWGMQEHDSGALWEQPAAAVSEGLIERSPWAPDTGEQRSHRTDAAPGPTGAAGEKAREAGSSRAGALADTAAPRPAPTEDEDDDLDRTRIARPRTPVEPRLRVVLEDGNALDATAPAVLGRNPSGAEGEAVLVIADTTRSISKTHLRLEVEDDAIRVTDLGSTNGTAHEDGAGGRELLEPHRGAAVRSGTRLVLGDRVLIVERTA